MQKKKPTTKAERQDLESLARFGAPVDDAAGLKRYKQARAAVRRAAATLEHHARVNPLATRAHVGPVMWAALSWGIQWKGVGYIATDAIPPPPGTLSRISSRKPR